MDGPVLTKTAFSAATLGFTPRTVYRNGAAASAGDIAAYDVLYYSESLSTVWAYSSRVTAESLLREFLGGSTVLGN